MVRVGGDVRIDGRRRALGHPHRPSLVVAARVERNPGEVEVVLVEPGEVVRGRTDLDRSIGIPRSAQRDRRLVEERVDVDRLVRLAVPAVLSLLDEPHHRGVALGEGGLVGKVGRRARRHDEREHGNEGEERETAGVSASTAILPGPTEGGGEPYGSGTRVYETIGVSSAVNNSSDRPDTRKLNTVGSTARYADSCSMIPSGEAHAFCVPAGWVISISPRSVAYLAR